MLFGGLGVTDHAQQDLLGRLPSPLGGQQGDESASRVVLVGFQFQGLPVMCLGFTQPVQSPGEHISGQRMGHRLPVRLLAQFHHLQETLDRFLESPLLNDGLTADDPGSTLDRRALVQGVAGQFLGCGKVTTVESLLGPGQHDVGVGEDRFSFDQAGTHRHDQHATGQHQ